MDRAQRKANNKARGSRNKRSGTAFENLFYNECRRQKINIIRFPDGCKTIGTTFGFRLVRVKTPFDFILSLPGKCVFVDTKSCSGNNFNHSDIEEHQAVELLGLHADGHRSGYVVYFNKHKKVIFYNANQLIKCGFGESLKIEDGKYLGDITCLKLNTLFDDDV